ncbi:hypothetical protein MNBD_GAMMA11-1810 [hydrothermal vent metagenome]|uniref:PilZ domain-containing protein n=1 Tax=hydrothermal vent metagenome TaxID=652676 RepID=A0A3B0XYI2_9ZZZZ
MQQRETRTPVANSTVVLKRNANTAEQCEYQIINISRGGLCFESHDNYELNEVVQVSVVIDKQTMHSASGRVCYRTQTTDRNTTCYGLSFLDCFIDADLIRRRNKEAGPVITA